MYCMYSIHTVNHKKVHIFKCTKSGRNLQRVYQITVYNMQKHNNKHIK